MRPVRSQTLKVPHNLIASTDPDGLLASALSTEGSTGAISFASTSNVASGSAEASLNSLLESTNDHIWSVDMDYRLTAINSAALMHGQEVYGVSIQV